MGYKQKTFEKNTVEFKNQIDNMMQYAGNELNIGKLLNSIMFVLDEQPVEGGNMKELEAIDKHIESLLQKMRDDIQKKNKAMLGAHAQLLNTTISNARRFGKESRTPNQIRAEEIVNESKALVRDALIEKSNILIAMRNIEEKAQQLDESSEEFMFLEQDYDDYEHQLEAIEDNIAVYRQRHNDNVEIANVNKKGAAYKKLPEKMVTAQEFDKEIAAINKMAAEENEYHTNISDSAAEFNSERKSSLNTTGVSGLRRITDEKKREQMERDIMSADVSGAAEPPKSSLKSKLGK